MDTTPRIKALLGLPADATELEVYVALRRKLDDGVVLVKRSTLDELSVAAQAAERAAEEVRDSVRFGLEFERARARGRVTELERDGLAQLHSTDPAAAVAIMQTTWTS